MLSFCKMREKISESVTHGESTKLYPLLAPAAWLYGAIVWIRNRLFDWNLLPSKSFDIPVISVGNLTVGGTGKTPHIEYLIRMLTGTSYRVAVLSRGYKRHTHGFRLVTMTSTAADTGDEPLQIKRKFPTTIVAVDANRRRGISRLLQQSPDIDVILLDDAYQHRSVVPAISILLTGYNRMIYEDKLLPVGRLREPISEKSRANIVIVTKCPDSLKPIDYRLLSKYLNLYPYQSLYFSGLQYDELKPVFPNGNAKLISLEQLNEPQSNTLIICGIAYPQPFIEYIEQYVPQPEVWKYGDHHEFSAQELKKAEAWVNASYERGNKSHIIVTEKDAARLIDNPDVPKPLKEHLYYLPLRIHYMLEQQEAFDTQIKDMITRFRRRMVERKK